MRAMTILSAAALVFALGCDRSTGKLKDLSYGRPFQGDYDSVLERTRWVLNKHYKYGLDPDQTREKEGEFWTMWTYRMAATYRDSTRERAHVKVEKLDDGKVRIGISVVRQLNDNIDNPAVKEEARWVNTLRDVEKGDLLVSEIARRYLKDFKPSKQFEEKYRTKKRKGMRQDIVDRNKDVNLEDYDDPDKKEVPSTTDTGKNKDPW